MDGSPRRSIVGVAGVRAVSTGLIFLENLVLARVLGISDFGAYSFSLGWALLLAPFGSLGFPSVVLRYAGHYERYGRTGDTKTVLLFGFVVSALASALLSTALWFFAPLMVAGAGSSHLSLISTASWLIPIFSVLHITTSGLRAKGKFAFSQFPEFIIRPGLILLTLGALLLVGETIDASLAVHIYVLSALFALIVGFAALVSELRASGSVRRISLRRASIWPRKSSTYMAQSVAFVLNRRLDVVLLGALAGSTAVGGYKVAASGASLISLPFASANQVMVSKIAGMHRLEPRRLQSWLSMVTRNVTAISLVLVAVFVVFGVPILQTLFGREYSTAFIPLLVLSIGHLVNVAAGPGGHLLNMTGLQRYALMAVAVGAATNVVLNVLLIPVYQAAGAAVATACSLLVWNALSVYWTAKKTGYRSFIQLRHD